MAYDTGRLGSDSEFVRPGEAAPVGMRLRPDTAPGTIGFPQSAIPGERRHAHPRRSRNRRASPTRRFLPLATALVAAILFITLTDGGRTARQTTPLQAYVASFLENVGLGLTEVTVTGQRMTTDNEIYDRLQLQGRRSIWLLDTEAARRRVETLPWVGKAAVQRVFPDRLHIVVEERLPRALWSDGRTTALIDASGRVLGPPSKGLQVGLPVVFGPGAAPHADAILTSIARIPELRGKVGVYEWTANRRWTLHLKSGQKILLPEKGQSLALLQLTRAERGVRLIDSDFQKLDLRVASQAAIRFPG